MWKYGNLAEALHFCNTGLYFNENDLGFLLKKTRIQAGLGNYDEARLSINKVLLIDPLNEDANKLFESFQGPFFLPLIERDFILVDYWGNYFNAPYKRRFNSAGIGYAKVMSFGPLIGRLNFAQTSINNSAVEANPSLQFEIESYPRISEASYLFVNYAYGIGMSFPNHRGGLELFHTLPRNFEASVGLRYLYWNENFIFYTGSIGKYWNDYWFSFRSFIVPRNNGVSQSYLVTARKYFETADDFLGITIGTGISPDEFSGDPAERLNLRSHKISLMHSKTFMKNLLIRSTIAYDYEEYLTGFRRGRISLNATLRYYL